MPLEVTDSDRYRFHDLLGLYARRLLAADDEAEVARSRLNAWCTEVVTAAMEWVYPQLVRLATHPAKASFFAGEKDALAWLDMETPTLLAVIDQVAMTADAELSWRIADQLRGYFLIRRQADRWLPAAETGLAAAERAGDDRARIAMLVNRAQALATVGWDDDALTDCLDGEALATTSGWTAAAAYLSHHVGWLHVDRGAFAEAARWLHKALRLSEGDDESHVRAVALNGLGVLRLEQGDLTVAVDLFTTALKINETTGRHSSALANRGNLASALRQLGDENAAINHLAAALAGYRHAEHPRGELSTLDEWSRLDGQRGDHTAALDRARQAHALAVHLRDVHAEAKTASTVATALLGAGRPSDAGTWFRRCLSIAGTRYPYLEAQALIGLAETQLALGDATSARTALDRATAVATRCGFRLLGAQAMAVSAEMAHPVGHT